MIKVADFGLTEDMYGTNYFRRRKSMAESETNYFQRRRRSSTEGVTKYLQRARSVSESEERVPIRWMAPESIENDIYNESTDVVRI